MYVFTNSTFRVIHGDTHPLLQVGSSHLDSDVFRLHFDYEVSHDIQKLTLYFSLRFLI